MSKPAYNIEKNKLIVWGLVFILIGFSLGMFIQRKGYIGLYIIPQLEKIHEKFFSNKSEPKKDKLIIDIAPEHLELLNLLRSSAMEKNILDDQGKKYMPARIYHNNDTIQAEIRLKGDWIDHMESDKWSFRVKITDNHTLNGMKTFSLQHPKTRNYIYEWIYHQTLKYENIISLRYQFVDVFINNKELGIYALEEHFDKLLVENNHRREGPIIKFDEETVWKERKRHPYLSSDPTGLQSESSSPIIAFHEKSIRKDTLLNKEFIIGKNLLEKFRNHQLKAQQVFAVQKMAMYFAVSNLTGALHGATIWHNLRFYYNPVISKLEPIGFDGNAGEEITEVFGMTFPYDTLTDFYDNLFKDTLFFNEYILALKKISSKTYLDNLFNKINPDLEKNLAILKSEYKDFTFLKEIFYKNQKVICLSVKPEKALLAYLNKKEKEYITVEAGNIQLLPVEILYVSYMDSILLKPAEIIVLQGKKPKDRTTYSKIKFYFTNNSLKKDDIKKLKIHYLIRGSTKSLKEKVFIYPRINESFSNNDFLRQKPNADEFNFIKIDNERKEIYIKPGTWIIKENMIIPPGYTVIMKSQTCLILSDSSKIISYSPLQFIGDKTASIIIQATGQGQGIAVLGAKQNSLLKYVTFKGLSAPSQIGWQLTGAVTFYESPVNINHCHFLANRCEDGLNIINSDFKMDNCFFNQTQSDAFDADFATGTISNTIFSNCNSDAIDVSGSFINIKNVFITKANDKGVSAGEHSYVNINKISIVKGNTGIASKDLSNVNIENIIIDSCNYGYTLFQKKPEFGPSSLNATSSSVTHTKKLYWVENGSILTVDQIRIEPNDKEIAKKMY